MNAQQLLQELEIQGGDVNAVFSGIGNPEDRYCLEQEEGTWHVFYSERGEKHEYRAMANEEQACAYLWELLMRDKTVWSQSKR